MSPLFVVVAVSVRRLHDHVVRLLEQRRIADQRFARLADVAGEHDQRFASRFPHAELQHGRAENVTGVVERHASPIADGNRLAIGHAPNSGSAGRHRLP